MLTGLDENIAFYYFVIVSFPERSGWPSVEKSELSARVYYDQGDGRNGAMFERNISVSPHFIFIDCDWLWDSMRTA